MCLSAVICIQMQMSMLMVSTARPQHRPLISTEYKLANMNMLKISIPHARTCVYASICSVI